MSKNQKSTLTVTLLTAFRVVIGWHFLYEGLVKLLMPDWTAASYLEVSNWIFAPVFHWMAANPGVLAVVDFLNVWGLILIGLSLMLGLFSRVGAFAGLVLLAFYYLSNPPFVGLEFGVPAEGHYLVVNKNLVELFGLALVAFLPTTRAIGLDRLLFKSLRTAEIQESSGGKKPESKADPVSLPRRELFKSLATLPVLGAFGLAFYRKKKWQSWEEQNLIDAETAASTKTLNLASLNELKGIMPTGTIKGVEFSRLIMGGNLLSGWAHSRDLIYVSQLVKAYHHKDKIFATLLLAEKCGVNTLLTNPIMCTMLKEYWKRGIGKMQF
ncbi:DoxX family protein, partial [candidate division KSB1 bacterium]|nr:DoxX family protein [candidate division KSB1 bacterium]